MPYTSLEDLDWEINNDIGLAKSSSQLNTKLLLRYRLANFIKKHADNLSYTDKSDYDKSNSSDNEVFNNTTDSLVSNPIKNEYPGEDSSYIYSLPQKSLQPLERSKSLLVASQKLSWNIEEDFVKEYEDDYGDLVRKNDKGEYHSLYSPAVEYFNGDKYWIQNDKLHRLDGPAREYANGDKEWYYEDRYYGCSSSGYNQEKFLEDLRNEGKIASMKFASYLVDLADDSDISELADVSSKSFLSLSDIKPQDLPQDYDNKNSFKKYIDRQKCFKLVDSSTNQIIGGVLLDGTDKNIYLTRIFIHPDYQSKGLGKMLLNEVENKFDNKQSITTNTPERLSKNVAFYKKQGYNEIGKTNHPLPLILFKKKFVRTQ